MSTQQHNILDCRPTIAGKVAFITGGFGGIGRECVKALLAHGANVAFTYVNGIESAEKAEKMTAEFPERLSAHVLDLRYLDSIKSCMAEVIERWGRIDILINNAAVGSATVSAFADNMAEQDSAMLTINADGTLKVCQTFLELMGHNIHTSPMKIINFSSVGGGIGTFPGFRLSDGMSKAAVAALTRQIAAELTDSLVDVFAICPGATNTAMFQASSLNHLSSDERQAFEQSMPKKRLIDPAEIANIVIFLASGYSAPMHGAVIDASMGLGVRPGLATEYKH
ncbi:MAG: NAD(P)-dependent dehydrogenase (short-subunit alcohol dehydrogenase family) [Candidatus Promineifilaceae bacterium]|jgi:NAD(P)-dependent dehydrogenase (short-subunit alcohol dehydrogenase family)